VWQRYQMNLQRYGMFRWRLWHSLIVLLRTEAHIQLLLSARKMAIIKRVAKFKILII